MFYRKKEVDPVRMPDPIIVSVADAHAYINNIAEHPESYTLNGPLVLKAIRVICEDLRNVRDALVNEHNKKEI